jgi:methionyl-tRNA formyltransferase
MSGVVLLAMGGAFSRVVLEGLVSSGIEVSALVVPGRGPRSLPPPRRQIHVSERTATHVAWERGLRVIEVGRPERSGPPDLVRGLEGTALAMACFPWILPPSWLALWEQRLNLHPSLLPAYRGPVPLFWQLRADEARTGVTVHRLQAEADAGDILGQADVAFDDGLMRDALETRLAEVGSRLLADALRSGASGRPQPEAGASRQRLPRPDDLEIPTSWSARRAFNFIRGAADWGPFTITTRDGQLVVQEATSFDPAGGTAGAIRRMEDRTEVGFSPGTVVLPSEAVRDLDGRTAPPAPR